MSTSAIMLEQSRDETSLTGLARITGFFFAFRVFLVVVAVKILQQDSDVGVGLSLGINLFLLGLVLFCAAGSARRTIGSILRLPCNRWVLLFLGFSGASLLWTVAVSLPAAAAFWCALCADVGIVVLLLRAGDIQEVSTGLMKGYVWGACCVAFLAWCFPAQTDLRLGIEDLLGANQIGYACGFAIFIAQYLILTREKESRWKVCAVFLAITMLRSLSKTTIVACLAGEAFLLIWGRAFSRRAKIMVLVITLVVIAAGWGLIEAYAEVYATAGNQAETLSGRLGIWVIMLGEAVEKPWFGHGFHSVWKVLPPYGPDQFEIRHAHNEVLQQFYAYGVAGVLMLIALYSSFYRHVKRMDKSPVRSLLLALLLFVLVRGLADTEAFDLSLPLWAIVLFSPMLAQGSRFQTKLNQGEILSSDGA
jgi:exopolysaccharide production protein ExoQ